MGLYYNLKGVITIPGPLGCIWSGREGIGNRSSMILTIASFLRMVFNLCIYSCLSFFRLSQERLFCCLVTRLYEAGFCIATAIFWPVKKCLHLRLFISEKVLFYKACNSVIALPFPWILYEHTALGRFCPRQGGPYHRNRTAKQKRHYSAALLPWLYM